jgi:hypothetical protein
MSHRLLLTALVAVAFVTPGPRLHAEPKIEGPYIVNDLEAARDLARKTGKPIFLVFRCEV